MTQSVLQVWEEYAKPRGWLNTAREREHRASYVMPNGSEIVIAGCDDPNRIMSSEYDTASAFEATELTPVDYELVLSRLSGDKMGWNQMVSDCNPGAPSHWLNKLANEGGLTRMKSSLQDNPVMWDTEKKEWTKRGERYYNEILCRLTGVRRRRLLDGLWSSPEGLVYHGLAETMVPCQPRLNSPATTVYGAIDWGWSDPTAILVGVLCEDGVLRVVEELYESRVPLEDLASRVSEFMRKWRVQKFYCDRSRPEIMDQLRRAGVPVAVNRVHSIDVGVSLVEQRLMAKQIELWDVCPQTVREAGEYEYIVSDDGKTKKLPEKTDNHAMDSLRYLVAAFDYARCDSVQGKEIDMMDVETSLRLGHPDPVKEEAERLQREHDRRFAELAWGQMDD